MESPHQFLPSLHGELWAHAAENFFTAFRIHRCQLAHEFVARPPLCILAPADTDCEKRGQDPNGDISRAHEKNKEAKRVSDNLTTAVRRETIATGEDDDPDVVPCGNILVSPCRERLQLGLTCGSDRIV